MLGLRRWAADAQRVPKPHRGVFNRIQLIRLGMFRVFFSTPPAILVRSLVNDLDATRWSS